MYPKALMVAVAALALTTSSAQAYSGKALARAKLTESQRAAFTVAQELQAEGDLEAAKGVLLDAGIDQEVIERLRSAHASEHKLHSVEITAALSENDYDAFLDLIEGTKFEGIVSSRDEFRLLRAAHQYREHGEFAKAEQILMQLGLPREYAVVSRKSALSQLSEAERDAFMTARAANDRDTMEAILEEAGILDTFPRHAQSWRLKDGSAIQES